MQSQRYHNADADLEIPKASSTLAWHVECITCKNSVFSRSFWSTLSKRCHKSSLLSAADTGVEAPGDFTVKEGPDGIVSVLLQRIKVE
jgi:hypothetical protein